MTRRCQIATVSPAARNLCRSAPYTDDDDLMNTQQQAVESKSPPASIRALRSPTVEQTFHQ